MDVTQADKIISTTDVGWRVVAVAVPTRALRVIVDDLNLIFRVEQLDITRNFKWRVVSTHAGDLAWESLGPSLDDLMRKQVRLKEKIKLSAHEEKMALIRAGNPHAS